MTETAVITQTAASMEDGVVLKSSKPLLETRRADYKPTVFLIDSVDLLFSLDAENTQVTSTLTVRRREGYPPSDLRLDGEGLKLLSLEVDDNPLEELQYNIDEDGSLFIRASVLPLDVNKPFTVRSKVLINPKANLKLSGLYLSKALLSTQCEAHGFRRITYFLDRPDVMSLYTVRLEADKALYPVLLSNGNRVDEGLIQGSHGRHYAIFQDPHRKPCYLFALVAGPLSSVNQFFTTMTGRKVKIEVFSEAEDQNKLEWALQAVVKSMRWDEKTFGLEYDLDVFNIVCVRDFNMGAMENKGLNIFNSSLLLADPKTTTDREYERILGVVGHEYFHNWTGNRVTCRDWFQLTLKEGLTVFRDQLFTADMCSAAVKRIEDIIDLRAHQFPEDSGPMSHPIRPESYISMDNFYTATVYEKGAEVIRMMSTLLGKEGFRKGMDLYFSRHDGQAVTCDDFRAAMADANNKDLTQFEQWYLQAGTPVLEVLEAAWDSQKQSFKIRLRQNTPATSGQPEKLPLVIPVKVGLLGKESKVDVLEPVTQVLELLEEEQTFEFLGIKEPCVVSLLRDFSAPVKIKDWQGEEDLAFLMAYDSDFANRWQSAQTLSSSIILSRVQLLTENPNAAIPPLPRLYTEAFRTALLQEDSDLSIKALTLQLPATDILAQELQPINPEALHAASQSVLIELSKKFKAEMNSLYVQLTLPRGTPENLDRDQVARRRLRNVLLHFLSSIADAEAAERAYTQFQDAGCMTDRYAALIALSSMHEHAQREKAFDAFLKDAQGDAIVEDKWFRAQALSDIPNTVELVAALQSHPKFTLKNPNRMRALFGALVFNRRHFHREDGAGYKLIGDIILKVDSFNSQAAARLAGSLLQWRRYDEGRQRLMQQQLLRISETPGMSPDVLEIVRRALKAA